MAAIETARELLLLLGGGLDSTALIPFYRRRAVPLRGVHIDYGQPSFAGERRAVRKVCHHFAVPLDTVDLGFRLASRCGEYAGRNAILLLTAASLASPPRSVAIGIHAGTPYYDSTPAFLADVKRLFEGYFGGHVLVEAPFVEFTKAEVYAFAVQARVPVELTYSCERRSDEPCGDCPSCLDREVLVGGE